jgi:hypothetical protein
MKKTRKTTTQTGHARAKDRKGTEPAKRDREGAQDAMKFPTWSTPPSPSRTSRWIAGAHAVKFYTDERVSACTPTAWWTSGRVALRQVPLDAESGHPLVGLG